MWNMSELLCCAYISGLDISEISTSFMAYVLQSTAIHLS
jgi:hypothetical protein